MEKKRPADKKVHELYVEKKLTCREIGNKYGVTRQAVHLWLKRLGIKAEDNTKIHVTCKKCGEDFFVSRYRWKIRKSFYCTVDCYVADRDRGYNYNRAGYFQSREIVKLYFNLKPKNIIHHVDGDSGNFELSNLWVFRNRSDHSVYHHCQRTGKKAPIPIWRGDQIDL